MPAATTTPPPGSAELVQVPKDVAEKIQLVEVARGLGRPVALVVAPGDARKRWFVVEQHAGRIRIIENGKLAPKPFLSLSNLSDGNEQGLLGLAFHPQYATNGKFYVNYTDADPGDTHIVEYKVSADPDVADPASRRELIRIKQPYSNHNGGHVVFGPDGKLWTGMGDGGSAGDPQNNGQDPKALLGKMLRLDADAPKPVPELVHMGVRNPWRFSFDAKTGDLMIADVGQNKWEYVFAVAGTDKRNHNFGWNVIEGNHCFLRKNCKKDGFTLPIVDFSHEEGCSITGGFVYRGKALPALDGRYFYADYCTGLLRSLKWTDGNVREHWDWKAAIDREGILAQVSSFGVDHDGELYVVELTGKIYKLAPR
ncbi:MAG: PQQ-dependent sugar dehydrogenase [Deltaproteobacteria bacterium]|nr:PQQ-dependent sugar dehydrogenase [Deltaproteobacteria bacterium]